MAKKQEIKIDYREPWNVLNIRKNTLEEEIIFIEILMGLLEKRTNSEVSKKIFFKNAK